MPPTNEHALIQRIIRGVSHSRSSLASPFRPGDDAAVLASGSRAHWVISTDWFLEGIHFLPEIHPPDSIGFKALARAASDLAAMGATPHCFLMTLALPSARTGRWLDAMLGGMRRASRRFGLPLAGGDTTRYSSLAISITVIGQVTPGRAILRSTARPGDLLYVSGSLGGAQLGLQLLLGEARRKSRGAHPSLRPHLYPEPRLQLGQWLASHRLASAMIDLSDGLSTDLHNLCRASGVGALVRAGAIPCAQLPRDLKHLKFDPLRAALHGGEDYELLFAVPRRLARRIPAKHNGLLLTPIGEITRSKRILLLTENGRATPLVPSGWDPFRPKQRRRT